MHEWIAKRITQLMGVEEEVFIGMVFNHLENLEVGGLNAGIQTVIPVAATFTQDVWVTCKLK